MAMDAVDCSNRYMCSLHPCSLHKRNIQESSSEKKSYQDGHGRQFLSTNIRFENNSSFLYGSYSSAASYAVHGTDSYVG